MKAQLIKVLTIIPLLLFFVASCYGAATTFDWAGNASTGSKTDWTNPKNWYVGSVQQTTAYPGFNGTAATTTDIVRIGINTATLTTPFTNFPVLAKSLTIASLTFGNNHAATNDNNGGIINFTVNNNGATATVLTVNGPIQQNHSTTGGMAGTGGTTEDNFEDFTYGIQTTLSGTGAIVCKSFNVGDNGVCANNNVVNVTAFRISNVAASSLSVTVNGTFTLNSASASSGGYVTKSSRALVSIGGGTLTVNGTINMTNFNPGPIKWAQYEALVGMSLDLNSGSSNSPVLNIGGIPAFNIGSADNTANSIDFYNPLGGTGTCTANYTAGGNQTVNTGWSDFTDIDPVTYQNLGFSGSGTKMVDGDAFTVLGNFTLAAGSETVDLTTNNPAVTINGNYSSAAGTTLKYGNTNNLTIGGTTTNNGIFNQSGSGNVIFTGAYTSSAGSTLAQTGLGGLTFSAGCTNAGTQSQGTGTVGTVSITGSLVNSGTITQTTGAYTVTGSAVNSGNLNLGSANFSVSGDFTNSGNYTQTSGTTVFNGSGTQHISTTGTMAFHNVTFNGTSSNKILQSGNYTVGDVYVLTMGGSNNKLTVGGGSLTLLSDANGSATVAQILSNCQINGNVTVQRYVAANRAYRLMSSPVNNGAANGNNIYSINYLLTNTYLTGTDNTGGTAGNQFDKIGNPTLYLYRENLIPAYTSFLNSNFRGIQNISAAPNYTINSDPVNTDPGTYNIPVGNGYLFYFRGSRKQKSLNTLTTPGAAATNDTLNAVGTLNQGNITVHDWYTPTSGNLGYTTISGSKNIEGMNLVGNPYPSSIDWDQYGTGITQTGVTKFIYKLIPTGQQGAGNYDVYAAGTPSKKGTQNTANSNIIVSGEGFFVQDTTANGTLTFTEAAKVNTQVTGSSLYMAKIPAAARVTPQFLHLQLASDSINTDGVIINFSNGASTAFNAGEDARYHAGTGRVNLATITSDNVLASINELPLPDKGQTIHLRLNAASSGTYTLNMLETSGIPQVYDIWLKDAYTKDSVNMRTNSTYSFAIALTDTNSFGSNRFAIVLSQNPTITYKLLSFDAHKADNNRQVQIDWKTVNELNSTHFTLERSTDNGKSYDVLDTLQSDGQGTYSFTDKEPAKGDNLYRLKQLDFNNNTTLSNVVDVQFADKSSGNSALSVYPNPAVSHITLDIDPKLQASSYKIKITNSFGLIVKQAVTTQTNWDESVSNLFTGTYLIQVLDNKNDSLIGQIKFVKL